MPHIRQVYDSLHEIDAALGELQTVALRERQDIIGLNLAGISECRVEIDKLLAQIGDLNTRIVAQIGSACDAFGLTGEKSLSQLIPVVPKPDRDMYARLQKSVRTGSVAAGNELAVNQALLKDSLAFTNYSLQMFTGILKAKTSTTYGQQGRFVETIDQPRIICKEI
ncbi:MAG TPA: flagellar export chaperone FlgN [Dongiaceae bacterium]|nr:flagellar export chaperone FlgN [Dongiaceae bacterium]